MNRLDIDKTVWKAITDNEQLKQWYFKLPAFKAEVGFEFRFTGGPSPEKQYLHICEVTEVVIGEKLTYSWRYDGYEGVSYVTFALTAQGDQTVLRFTHEGLESFPVHHTDFARGNFVEGWMYFIDKALKQFLEAK